MVTPPVPKPTPAPKAPPPPTATPTGTYDPYGTDPAYQNAKAQEALGVGTTQAQLNSQIAQRLLALGDPSLAGKYGLDPAMIQQNYNSGNATLARLDQSHKQNLQAIINRLAAHGILNSGETGYQTVQEDRNYGNNRYDAEQAAIADILGYRQSALQQQQSLHDAVSQALENAYQNSLNHPELYGYGQVTGTAPDAGGNYQFGTAQQVAAALAAMGHTPDQRNGF